MSDGPSGFRRSNRCVALSLLCCWLVSLSSVASGQQAGRAAPIDPLQAEKSIQKLQSEREAKRPPVLPAPDQSNPRLPEVPAFRLRSVSIIGARAISSDALRPVYSHYLQTTVSQRDLATLVGAISDAYRKAGYYLSRAIIPPQDIQDGHITIRVIEGSISEIRVIGDTADRFGVRKRLDPILHERPSRLNTVERQLVLANNTPGVHIEDTAIEEIGTATGEFRLIVRLKTWGIFAGLGFDDLGTYAIGPLQSYGTVSLNSLFARGDSLGVSAATVPNAAHEFRYGRVSYDVPVANALYAGASALESKAAPAGARGLTDTRVFTRIYEAHGSYVALASPGHWLALGVGIGIVDSTQTEAAGTDYNDRAATVNVSLDYRLRDALNAWNYLGLNWRQGLSALGATSSDDPFSSRYGARPDFSILGFSYTRLQPLAGPWSLKAAIAGQIASTELLNSQQFYLGGAAFGPGYYSGDSGYSALAEIRFDQTTQGDLVQAYQVYGFVDGGQVWYLHQAANSLVSAGVGLRLQLPHDLQASIGLALPVGYSSETDEWRKARILFSISSALRACSDWTRQGCSQPLQ